MLIDVMPGLGPALAHLPGHPTVVMGLVVGSLVTGLVVTGACTTARVGDSPLRLRAGAFWRRRRRSKRAT